MRAPFLLQAMSLSAIISILWLLHRCDENYIYGHKSHVPHTNGYFNRLSVVVLLHTFWLPEVCLWWAGKFLSHWLSAEERGSQKPAQMFVGFQVAYLLLLLWPYEYLYVKPFSVHSSYHTQPCSSAKIAQLYEETRNAQMKSTHTKTKKHIHSIKFIFFIFMVSPLL